MEDAGPHILGPHGVPFPQSFRSVPYTLSLPAFHHVLNAKMGIASCSYLKLELYFFRSIILNFKEWLT